MRTARSFVADDPEDRRSEALLALVDEGLSAREIAALCVEDVRIFNDSATVRIVTENGVRFIRVCNRENLRDLRGYVERDALQRRTAPLFPGRSRIRGMSIRRLYQLLAALDDPNAANAEREMA